MTWNDGYNTRSDYTYTYCGDINPLKIRYTLLTNGFMPPDIKQACELGFGQGLSINFHATNSDIAWTGNDFLPTHVSFASHMQKSAGTEIDLSDMSFKEMANHRFEEKFDYICLHGIWSWISEDNREYIKSFFRQNLNDGGVVYLSYNTKPGWAAMLPMRDLLAKYIQSNLPIAASIGAKTREAIKLSSKLMKVKPLYLSANPTAEKRLNDLERGDVSYIAHEYFNADWKTFYFSDVDASIDDCKLRYVGSTDFMAGIDDINLTNQQRKMIAALYGQAMQQDTRDVFLNQSFRKDVWIKGGIRLSRRERTEEINKLNCILRDAKSQYDYEIKGNLGAGKLQKEIYEPILDYLRRNKVATIGDIITSVSKKIAPDKAMEAIHILLSKDDLVLVHDPVRWEELEKYGRKINAFIHKKVINGYSCSFLYSALTGGGLQVNLLQQLFIGISNTHSGIDSNQLAKKCLPILKSLGRNILDAGKPVDGHEAELEVITNKANDFLVNELESYKFLKIAY